MSSSVNILVNQPVIRVQQSQGLPGPPGLPGGASDSIISMQTDDILVPGSPVYVTATTRFELAQADDVPQTRAIGLSLFATAVGFPATVQTQDIVTLTTVQWDAVTGDTGGLTASRIYYLDQLTLGMITLTIPVFATPSSRYNTRIGIAINSASMNLKIRPAFKLS